MAEELGKIEEPLASEFGAGRKLYLVPLIFKGADLPEDYLEKFERYWQQVREQVGKLEASLGKVNRIYHELISLHGDSGLRVLEKLSPRSYLIVSERISAGAVLEAVDDKDLIEETVDWERCLLLGLISRKVENMVSQFYSDASHRRFEHISKRLDSTLKDGETGILFIREGHGVQFARDIQVISVSPPALDEVHRWVRSRAAEVEGKTVEGDSK